MRRSIIKDDILTQPRAKIPRPVNAFMLYANENRKKMAQIYPQESNKEISKRLGDSWKSLDIQEKERYFQLAKVVDAEHKRKYPDYVYNPKEARLRKAMREASRDRAMGTAPMPPPRVGRRSQTWPTNAEEQLMMAPSHDMRAAISSPMCSSPVFSSAGSGNIQFMEPMHSYSKLIMSSRSTNNWLQGSPGGYLQHAPMAELHQANVWHQYTEPVRTCSAGSSYMIENSLLTYQQQTEITPRTLTVKECKVEPEIFPNSEPIQSSQSETPSKVDDDKIVTNEQVAVENREDPDEVQPLVEVVNLEQNEQYLPVYTENVVVENPFDKEDNLRLQKDMNGIPAMSFLPSLGNTSQNSLPPELSSESRLAAASEGQEPLPLFVDPNFGFCLTPPDCPLANPLPDDTNQDSCYSGLFDNFSDYSRLQIPEDLTSFSYVCPCANDLFGNCSEHFEMERMYNEKCNPHFIPTEVGVIPMFGSDQGIERIIQLSEIYNGNQVKNNVGEKKENFK